MENNDKFSWQIEPASGSPLKEEEQKILDDYSVGDDANFITTLHNFIAFNRKNST
jgi:hypothetical protein